MYGLGVQPMLSSRAMLLQEKAVVQDMKATAAAQVVPTQEIQAGIKQEADARLREQTGASLPLFSPTGQRIGGDQSIQDGASADVAPKVAPMVSDAMGPAQGGGFRPDQFLAKLPWTRMGVAAGGVLVGYMAMRLIRGR